MLKQSPHNADGPVMSPILAQRVYERLLYLVAPAVVAGAVTGLRSDSIPNGLLVTAVSVVVAVLLRPTKLPMNLVPLARVVMAAAVPSIAVAVSYALSKLSIVPISLTTAAAAAAAASVIGLLALWLEQAFSTARPVRMALVGSGAFSGRLASELAFTGIKSYEVIGYISAEPEGHASTEWLGPLSEIRSVVLGAGIDLLVVGPDTRRLEVFEKTARECLDLPVRMIEATALYESVLGHVPIGAINSAWFQFIMHPLHHPSSPLSKRLMDIIVGGAILVAALPVLAICALALKLSEPGAPLLYRQRRVGEAGREFMLVKFRTLVADADERFMAGSTEDELITPVGRVLRRLHLNELPQLFQVVRGDLSLVGPRPEPPSLVLTLADSVPHYERRALVKPGLTGWAQVRCGYAGDHYGTAWKMCHDLYYIKHRSIRFDFVILLQTLRALRESSEVAQMPSPDFIFGDKAEPVATAR